MSIAIIGGGLQGVALALELAARGRRSTLIEAQPRLMQRASNVQEGKLHLGYTYAMDRSLATQRLMITGTRVFGAFLARWLGRDQAEALATDPPFAFAVRHDSLCPPEDLAAAYAATDRIRADLPIPEGMPRLYADGPEMQRLRGTGWADPAVIAALFQSSERAINPQRLHPLLEARLRAEPLIEVATATTASHPVPAADGVRLTLTGTEGAVERRFEHAVNCSWGQLWRLNHDAGFPPTARFSWRWRNIIRLDLSEAERPRRKVSVVHGPFGDVVDFGDGTLFLSWYPIGRTGFASGLEPPPDWRVPERAAWPELATWVMTALLPVCPELSRVHPATLQRARVEGGLILALDGPDIDSHRTPLHGRDEAGIGSAGRWHWINTGKWTVAPLFAIQMAERLTGATV